MAAAVVVAALEILWLFLASAAGMVVVNGAYFVWTNPPTVFCPNPFTTGGAQPNIVVTAGGTFNLSWGIGCQPYGPGNTTGATFSINSVTSSTLGFTVVSSNVPVVFGYNLTSDFTVIVRAPSWSSYGSLELEVVGGPYTAR